MRNMYIMNVADPYEITEKEEEAMLEAKAEKGMFICPRLKLNVDHHQILRTDEAPTVIFVRDGKDGKLYPVEQEGKVMKYETEYGRIELIQIDDYARMEKITQDQKLDDEMREYLKKITEAKSLLE